MNWKTITILFILSALFWYGMYNAVGNWIWVVMMLGGLSLIAVFYKLIKG